MSCSCSKFDLSDIIEQLKFIGAKATKENRIYCYFEFEGDISKTRSMLGIY